MSSFSKTGFLSLAATLLIAVCVCSTAQAAPQFPLKGHTGPCEHNPNIDPTLRICAATHDGTTYYRIDALDGTHAELAISSQGIDVQQSGPDPIRVVFADMASGLTQFTASASGVTRRVYQDALLAIYAVQNGALPPTLAIYPSTVRIVPPLQGVCTGALCSGGIQIP